MNLQVVSQYVGLFIEYICKILNANFKNETVF